MSAFRFKLLHQSKKTRARAGEIHTLHGVIKTPSFVPVGTQATVKSLTPDDLKKLDIELFFVNTYHAYLRPGLDVIKKHGGLHKFINWERPLITDSGGFQVFSLNNKKHINIAISESAVLDRVRFTKKLSKKDGFKEHVYPDDYQPVGELVKIDDKGVTFTSHWDGSKHRFTPEKSIEIQHILGADIILCFDECAPYPTDEKYASIALQRTHNWAVQCLDRHTELTTQNSQLRTITQALYGIVQGSVYKSLRQESARFISNLSFDGIAIGGVSVGESKKQMQNVCDWTIPLLPPSKPRHLLGVGEIDDIFEIIERGIDTFDCVQPTRLARMGKLFVTNKIQFTIDITKKTFAEDLRPIDRSCKCYTCLNFTRAYLHHLFRVRELLAYRLATIHNLSFVQALVSDIRRSIQSNNFIRLKNKWLQGYNRGRR